MSPNSRRAALLLHAMGEFDRQWTLARLAPSDRSNMDALLAELRELGIPADKSLIRTALEDGARSNGSLAQVVEDPIAAASPDIMVELLRYESQRTIALVLSLQEWSWRQAFLARLPQALRDDLLETCVLAAPPSLAVALRAILIERLGAIRARPEDLSVAIVPSSHSVRKRFGLPLKWSRS
ncbi:MAG: hypothetical protein QM803_09790 [Rhodocyclaceae bacterium]